MTISIVFANKPTMQISSDRKTQMSTLAIIGIVVLVFIICLAVAVVWGLVDRRKKEKLMKMRDKERADRIRAASRS